MHARSRHPDHSVRRINIIGGLMLLILAGLYLFLDYLAAASLSPVAALLACALSLPGSLLLAHGRARAWRLAAPVAVIALLLAVAPLNWDSRKPFLRAFNQIEPGMTIAQVDHLMAAYMRGPAAAGALSEWGTVAYRHTDQGWGDADVGLVHFADGQVTAREFLPD